MKPSKIVSSAAILVIAGLLPLSINGAQRGALLEPEDLAREEQDRESGPALGGVIADPRPWASYNQWMCFETDSVFAETVTIATRGNPKPWPQLAVSSPGQEFIFSPSIDSRIDATATLESWKTELSRPREICFYAAFLQYLETNRATPTSLWVLEAVKTDAGYWNDDDALVEMETSD